MLIRKDAAVALMNFNIRQRITSFIDNSRHVLNVSYKPDIAEFNRTARIIILGILLIGLVGFIISVIIGYITGIPI